MNRFEILLFYECALFFFTWCHWIRRRPLVYSTRTGIDGYRSSRLWCPPWGPWHTATIAIADMFVLRALFDFEECFCVVTTVYFVYIFVFFSKFLFQSVNHLFLFFFTLAGSWRICMPIFWRFSIICFLSSGIMAWCNSFCKFSSVIPV